MGAQEHMDGPTHVAAKSPVTKVSAFSSPRSLVLNSLQQQDSVTLIVVFQMFCAAFGSSLTMSLGVKMFFQRQNHADAGELVHERDCSLGRCSSSKCRDGRIGTDARQLGLVAPTRPRSGWEILIYVITRHGS